MEQYHELLYDILDRGVKKDDRTGTGTLAIFGAQLRFVLGEGFPLLTTKDMSGSRWNAIVHELLWFIAGDTHLDYLIDNGVHIWTPDAHRAYRKNGGNLPYEEFKQKMIEDGLFRYEHGDMGYIYGSQWRNWGGPAMTYYDQLQTVIREIRANPTSRRLIVNSWNVGELDYMVLPPCHVMFQFDVSPDGRLSCMMTQRSADVFLGLPFNIASYALLTHMVAQVTGYEVGDVIISIGSAHIYNNHLSQVDLLLNRRPKPLCKLWLDPLVKDITDFRTEHIKLIGYDAHPPISAPVSVG